MRYPKYLPKGTPCKHNVSEKARSTSLPADAELYDGQVWCDNCGRVSKVHVQRYVWTCDDGHESYCPVDSIDWDAVDSNVVAAHVVKRLAPGYVANFERVLGA